MTLSLSTSACPRCAKDHMTYQEVSKPSVSKKVQEGPLMSRHNPPKKEHLLLSPFPPRRDAGIPLEVSLHIAPVFTGTLSFFLHFFFFA